MAERTPWVAGLPGLSGDPSPWTARGCVAALEAVAQQMPDFSLERARFGVVGLGSTGFGSSQSPGMVRLLAQRYPAATFVGWDSDQEYFRRVLSTGLVACCQDVFTADIDALLLCGPSGMLMPETVERLSSSVRLIGGSANVQCSDPLVDAQLLARGIVRLPEELANGAGARIVGAEAFLTRCYMVGIRDDGGTYDPAGRMTFVAERFDLQEVGAETLAYIGQQSALRFREVLGARTGRTSLPVHTIQSARVSIARLSPAIDVSPKEF